MNRRSADELVTVASAHNQVDAEFVQKLLRDAGVPSILRRSAPPTSRLPRCRPGATCSRRHHWQSRAMT